MELLYELCQTSAVSGNESMLAEKLERIFKPYGVKTTIDHMGNLLGVLDNGADATILLEAHMDEIGLLVQRIDENGFLKFAAVGGVDPAILPSQEVVVHGRRPLAGVIGSKPPHLQSKDDTRQVPEIRDLYIDCGYTADEMKQLVSEGDYISFPPGLHVLCGGRLASKAIDNRMGIYVVAECLKRLHGKKLPYNLAVAATVQEEVGCRGAVTAAFQLQPDIAFVIDVTHGISPYMKEDAFEVGAGITIAVGPNLDRKYSNRCMDFCRTHQIPFSREVRAGNSGTDSWPIQVSREGVRCVLISVPLKYMHTPVETVCLQDIQYAADLICGVLEGGEF